MSNSTSVRRPGPAGHRPGSAVKEIHPNGCRYCGLPRSQPAHGRQWYEPVGMHQWTRPTDAQIKARMLARRAARTA